MKKIKISVSFLLFLVFSIIFNKFFLLLNYLSALVLHELSHLLVAKHRGYKLKEIRLDLCGLSVSTDQEILTEDNFAVNIAGPIGNLIICILCLALFFVLPAVYNPLKTFCFSNLVLAVFNLIPVYPLDGGKIFLSLFKSKKVYKRLDLIIRITLTLSFVCVFVISCFKNINFTWLVFAIFFAGSKPFNKPTFSIFKFSHKKRKQKVKIIKIDEDISVLELLKCINEKCFTIFYSSGTNLRFIDENELVKMCTKLPISTKIKDIKNF